MGEAREGGIGTTLDVEGRRLEATAYRGHGVWTLAARWFPEVTIADTSLAAAKAKLAVRLAPEIRRIVAQRQTPP
jgi:hypothetical protein